MHEFALTKLTKNTDIALHRDFAEFLQYFEKCTLLLRFFNPILFAIVLVHSANCVKTYIQWHAEECSVALLCN
jgi:hypothetical protein